MRVRWIVLASLLGALLLLAACGDDAATSSTSTAPADTLEGSATVVAAQSLKSAFGDMEKVFEIEHPAVDLEMTFDGSAKLAAGIISGAPADLFASADEANLQKVVDEDLTSGDPVVFARNSLQIVVAEDNPLGITTLADLTKADVKLSLCGLEVPCGKYAGQAFDRAGLETPAAGDQPNVAGVLSQVALGEADTGIVYVTDVLAAEDVEGVDLAASAQVVATYPASVLADAANPTVAEAFLAFLTSTEARDILLQHGFEFP